MTDGRKIKSCFCYLFSADVPRQKLKSDNCAVETDSPSGFTAQPSHKQSDRFYIWKKCPCEKALIFWNEKDIAREVSFFLLPFGFPPERGEAEGKEGKALETAHQHGAGGDDFRARRKLSQVGERTEFRRDDTRIAHGCHGKAEGIGDFKTCESHKQCP